MLPILVEALAAALILLLALAAALFRRTSAPSRDPATRARLRVVLRLATATVVALFAAGELLLLCRGLYVTAITVAVASGLLLELAQSARPGRAR